ncbi:uncharacterized protein LOC115322190 [Ixodes scapularis]|uniref:uncharacterized protein LOC115322190 n=1 Tax=Ixodes scapularis TaxID=6945 RepID=UPI001AD64DE8|nr:uncharacterized protein LOC115322190 [Ixodes scapularis]
MELSLEEGRSSLSSSSCTSSSRPDSRSSCGIPDVRSSEIELSLEEGRSSPSSSSCTSSSRPDSRSSCGIPDVRSSEIELSLEEGRSSPTSSTCTYSSRPDSQSSCGIPDDQSSEIGLSLEEEGCSSASWDHTYSCLPLENSPLEAHADHSYALPQNAVPAHESSGDMADMAPSIYGPSPEDSLSSSAGVLSHRASSKARSTDKRKMDALRAKVRQVREQNKRLQRRLQRQRQMRTVAEVVESVRIHVSPAVAALVEAQLRMRDVSRFGRRWCSQNKALALGLYFHSPKGYKYCRRLLRLPSVRSLQLWLQRVPLRVGFYPEIFELVKRRATSFSRADRACSIVFDEMHIKKELSYNPSSDRFEGLEEYSNGVQGANLSNKALVFMAKGIRTPWKQPLGYFFAHKGTPTNVLQDLLFQCYSLLVDAGLEPVAVVCDQGSQNISLFSSLITPEKPYIDVNGKPLFFLFDAPHPLKCLRNMLFKYDFKVCDQVVKSSYIKEAYEKDRKLEIRSMPKLNAKHFDLTFCSKMSVKLAAQVFSNHCAAAMYAFVTFQQLPPAAIHTARFVERIDRLFDSLNSSHKSAKTPFASAMHNGSVHEEFFKECIEVFETPQVLGCRRQPNCIRGFCLTMRSLMMLCNHLTVNFGFTYILTRHLNQDTLENTFAIIRSKSGANANSTSRQFQAAFRHLLVSNLFKLTEKSNCAEDMMSLLATLPVGLSAPSASLPLGSSVFLSAADESPLNYPSAMVANNMVYFAGWLATRFLKGHSCVGTSQRCELKKENACFSEGNQVLLYLSVKGTADSDFGNLSVPSPSFTSFVEACERVFEARINNLISKEGIGRTLCVLFHQEVQKSLVVCDNVYDDLFSLFARVRLHWFARKKNTELVDASARCKTRQHVQRLSS